MSILDKIEPAPRKIKHVIVVVDMNEKLSGYYLSITKTVLEEVIRNINEISVDSDDCYVKLAVLQYGGCSWVTSDSTMVDVEDYFLSDNSKHEMIGLGQALLELNDKLCQEKFLKSNYGAYIPVIVFIGSGYLSTDISRELTILKENRWFKHSVRIAIKTIPTIEDGVFSHIIGNPKLVFTHTDVDSIKKTFSIFIRDDFVS